MSEKLRYVYDRKRHLVCVPYSIYNLHQMAKDLGIKRCWYHRGKYPHYDIPVSMMNDIGRYADEVDSKTILMIIKEGM